MLQTSYPQQLNSDNDVVMTMLHQIEQDSCLTWVHSVIHETNSK